MCHTLTCLAFIIHKIEPTNEDFYYKYGVMNMDLFDEYVIYFYFICATMTTVGYGDLAP